MARAPVAPEGGLRMGTPQARWVLLTTVLAFVVIGLSQLLGPRRGSMRKLMPYESGMTPIGSAMRRIGCPPAAEPG